MNQLADTMRQVAADCETDAMSPKPFTGRGVGETFGETLAMLAAVATAVALLAEQVEGLARTLASRTDHLV